MGRKQTLDFVEKLFSNNNAFNFITSTIESTGQGLDDYEIYATEKATVLELDTPGVQKSEIKIKVDGEVLEVSWKRAKKSAKIPITYIRKFDLKIIPKEEITASLTDGVLTILIPHTQSTSKQKEVTVK